MLSVSLASGYSQPLTNSNDWNIQGLVKVRCKSDPLKRN